MNVLDSLINKNKEPKEGMEYLYVHDMIWKPNKLEGYPVKFGAKIIVDNVVKLKNDSFQFTIKGTEEIYRTNYGWALVENTKENILRLNNYLSAKDVLLQFENYVKVLRQEVIDLNGPSKLT
jgi:hypothetical protein